MVFKGTGLIYSPAKKKMIINFKNTPVVETDDPYEIELLQKALNVECIDSSVKINVTPKEEKEPTKKELIEQAKKAGIKGADRMSKDDLLISLEAE